MHIILTGATGLVGSAALDALLLNAAVTKVTILSRKPVPQADGHAKAKVLLHQDFSTFPSPTDNLAEAIKDANGCIWALGISQLAVPKDKYIQITKDYSNAFIKYWSSVISQPGTFVYVSGEGATHNPGRLTRLFGVVKGEAEKDLLSFSEKNKNISVYVARPAAVDPGQHKELSVIGQNRPLFGKMLFPLMYTLYPSVMSPTRELGQSLVMLAMMKGEGVQGPGTEYSGHIITNVGLRAMMKL